MEIYYCKADPLNVFTMNCSYVSSQNVSQSYVDFQYLNHRMFHHLNC